MNRRPTSLPISQLCIAMLLPTLPGLLACGAESTPDPAPSAVQMPGDEVPREPNPAPLAAGDLAPATARREAPGEWFACEAATDCTAFEMGPCDHCNDGWIEASRTEHAEEIGRRWGDNRDDQSCTEIACNEPRAECNDGMCQAVDVPVN